MDAATHTFLNRVLGALEIDCTNRQRHVIGQIREELKAHRPVKGEVAQKLVAPSQSKPDN